MLGYFLDKQTSEELLRRELFPDWMRRSVKKIQLFSLENELQISGLLLRHSNVARATIEGIVKREILGKMASELEKHVEFISETDPTTGDVTLKARLLLYKESK